MVEVGYGAIELGLSFIVIPWVVFVTISIFTLQKQLAVMKVELSILHEIKAFIKEGKKI